MSLQGKNRAVYSYNNADRRGSNFMYKNFDKANCYNSDFRNAIFDGASLRATKIKYCNMSHSHFCGTEFIGTNIRGTRFNNSVFVNAIFLGVKADGADFKGCSFFHCIFDGGLSKAKNFDIDMENNIVLSKPDSMEIPSKIISCAEEIIKNSSVRNSVIQMKKGKINKPTLMMLLYDFTEDELLRYLKSAVEVSPRNCTVSHLRRNLIKIREADTI